MVDESASSETAIVYPSKDLREYVRMLRKIERAPAEAPLTSSAIRSLERARKNRGRKILDQSRLYLSNQVVPLAQSEQRLESVVDIDDLDESVSLNGHGVPLQENHDAFAPVTASFASPVSRKNPKPNAVDKAPLDRKTISEVLHDIYDKNIQ